jgi:hypothetical protein
MFDTTPGGNGLSAEALTESRMSDAWAECLSTLDELADSTNEHRFHEYIGDLLNIDVTLEIKEVRHVCVLTSGVPSIV